MYYTKYFEGNFYINNVIYSVAMFMSTLYIGLVTRKFGIKGTINVICLTTIFFSIVFILMNNYLSKQALLVAVPINICVLSMLTLSMQVYAYHVN